MRIKGVIEKDKEYLDSGENPPKGVPVHTGPHQGKFYNTEDAEKIASPISGKEIMEKFNLLAGKTIGEVKEFLTNKVMDGELKIDDKDSAYSMAEQYIKEKGLKKSFNNDNDYNELNIGVTSTNVRVSTDINKNNDIDIENNSSSHNNSNNNQKKNIN